MSEDQSKLLVRVDVPDIKTQKCVVLSLKDTVWSAKQVVLDKLNQDLPYNPLNYGLYLLPSIPGKLGKYMEEGRALRDYVLHGHVPRLELRYKRRDYSIQVSLREKDIIKANSKANHRKFVEHVVQGSVKKVEKMLETGSDPNFITEDGNTPLGVACGRNSNIQVIMPLLSNGAHIDFRGKDGLTALHRAALGGNSAAIKILLSYGASPNYRDIKGLTPLYHTSIMGDDTSCCESLLRYHADVGIRDHSSWTELHQASRHGHADHVDLLIRYKADIHAQNSAGNTPLHVSASHRQSKCALLLLKRGADKTKLNFSSQLPAQVAILCGHHSIATEINSFQPEEVELITTPPDYNPNARHFDPKLYADTTTSEVCPISPPAEVLVDTLTQEWTGKAVESCPEHTEAVWPKAGSSHSIPSMSSGIQLREYRHDTTDTGSLSSLDRDSIHSTSTAGTGTPGQNTPLIYAKRQPAFATQRERLYRAGPGKYVATENVEPKQSDDIPLRRGMEVEVVFIGKGGYWEGRAGGRQGWFPAKAIKDVEDEDSGVFVEPAGKSAPASGVSIAYTSSQHQSQPAPPAAREGSNERWRMEERDKEPPHMAAQPPKAQTSSSDEHLNPPSSEQMMSNIKEVIVQRGTKGYGFAMRGVKATNSMKFHPTPQVPALQYVGNVEPGGSAEVAGLKVNDFLLEINGHNVTYSTHDDVVNIIRKAGSFLRIKIITPLSNRSTRTSIQLQKAVEITDSSSLSTDHRANSVPVPVKVEPPRQPQPLSELNEEPERETVIDGGYPAMARGQESPGLDRIDQMGWDSSQDEEKIPTPTLFGKSEKFSYLNPIVIHTMPSSKVESSRMQSISPPSPLPPQEENYNYGALESNQRACRKASKSQSSTPPYLPQKDYPQFGHLSESSESENESDFAQALKKGRKQLANSPYQQRHRSSTMLDKGRPSNPSLGSQLERQIKEVQQKWNKGSSHGPSTAPKNLSKNTKVDAASAFSTQPLAAAIMRKIDSIQIESSDGSSSEEEQGTPQIKTSMRISTEKSEQPPPVQPKPHFRRVQTVEVSDWRGNGECTMNSSSKKQLNSTLKSSTTGIESSSKNGQDVRLNEASGLMNWKSALQPTESGRKHKGPSIERTRSDISSQSPPVRQFSTKSTAANSAPKVFNSTSKGMSSNNFSQKTAKRYDPAETTFKNSPLYKSNAQHSFNENPITQIGKLSMESQELPPPLPPVDNRLSSEFVDLPPPVSFVSVAGSSVGEFTTDDFIPTPAQDESDDEGSLSSPPPPPPDTSPPREPFDGGSIDSIKFPTTKEDVTFPSPLPSPLHPSSFDADIGTAMLLPPHEFTHPQGPPSSVEEYEIGFQLPTTQKKVDTFPLSSEVGLGRASNDFDEMIHQLQQLSVNLDTESSQPKNERQTRVGVSAASKMEEIDSGVLPSDGFVDVPSVVTSIQPIERKNIEISTRGTESSRVYSIKEMEEWDVADVCQWLEDIGLGEHCPQFQENEILGEHLLDLSKEELTEIGVKKMGHKKTLLTKIKEFKLST